MDFKPVIRNVAEMDHRIFCEPPMGIREQFMLKELRKRVTYQSDSNTLNLDFSSLELETIEDVDNIKRVVEEVCKKVGRKVNAIVNYNGFRLDDNIFDAYMEMGEFVISNYYHRVARHNTNEKTRSKFDNEYRRRELAANIFASREEALEYIARA